MGDTKRDQLVPFLSGISTLDSMLLLYRTLFYYNPCNTYFHHDIFKYQEVMKLVYLLNDSCLIIVY